MIDPPIDDDEDEDVISGGMLLIIIGCCFCCSLSYSSRNLRAVSFSASGSGELGKGAVMPLCFGAMVLFPPCSLVVELGVPPVAFRVAAASVAA